MFEGRQLANEQNGNNYVISDSGVKVWRSPQFHPMLMHTNLQHPDFLRKAAETYPKGLVRGLPKICSENSEDARTWLLFSPLLEDRERREMVLGRLLSHAFPLEMATSGFRGLAGADLYFWHGKETRDLELVAPGSLPFRQGLTEVDAIVTVSNELLLFVEAKYHSGVSSGVRHSSEWNQVIRNIDTGSWFARGHFARFYFILLQYGDYSTSAESVVLRYKDRPTVLRKALAHREDLDDK